MKTADLDILIVPGWSGSGPDHWQTRWQEKLSTARRVEQDDWHTPQRDDWTARIAQMVHAAGRPVLLVAHSLGAVAVAHAAPLFTDANVSGAFLVAPPAERAIRAIPGIDAAFAPYPRSPLPFPTALVASRTDPYATYEEVSELGGAWGSQVIDAADSGHINAASGHGPWPEGLMSFAGFIRRL